MALNNAILYLRMTVLPAGHLALRIQVSHKLLRTQERLRLHKHTPTPDGHSLRLGFSFLPVLSPPHPHTDTHCSLPSWLSSSLLAAFPPLVPADGSKSGPMSGTKPVGPHRAQSLPQCHEHLLIRRVPWKLENICLPLQIHPDSPPSSAAWCPLHLLHRAVETEQNEGP